MFFEHFKMLNMMDDNDKKIYLVPVKSEEINEFNQYYMYIYNRVKEINDENLLESFDTLKYFFNSIRGTVFPFNRVLEDMDLRKIGIFFSELNNADYEEETKIILQRMGKLIKKFRSGNVGNKLGEQVEDLYSKYQGKNAIVSYYYPKNIDADYNFINVNQFLVEDIYYDNIFFIGSPNFYKKRNTIFKANNTFYIAYDIYQMKIKEVPLIQGNAKENINFFSGITVYGENLSLTDKRNEYLENTEDTTSLPLKNILLNYKEREINTDYTILSNIIELAAETFIFFPANSTLKVFDKLNDKIISTGLNDIKTGDWIVIKQSSDEEFIREKAKEIIGPEYEVMYDRVTHYKNDFIKLMQKNDWNLEQLRKTLLDYGLRVQYQLLKQWVYGSTIAPRNYLEILSFLGYESNEKKQLEIEYRKIRAAHTSAGRLLVSNIQEVINQIGADSIYASMNEKKTFFFELKDVGTFSIEEVKKVLDDPIEVEYKELYKVMSDKDTTKENRLFQLKNNNNE